MTLTDFLLARIAEDEERAQFVASQVEANNWTPLEQWKLSWHDEYDLLCVEPARMLAECEAKRRIVKHADAFADCEVHPGRKSETDCDECIAAWRINVNDEWYLRFLALPYADHPDYREEWKL